MIPFHFSGITDSEQQKEKNMSGLAAFQAEASDEEDAFGAAPKFSAFKGATILNLAQIKRDGKTDELMDYYKTGN